MALFNYATKEITLKIVYYGPGLSGKTTNLQQLHAFLEPAKTGKLLSLATEADRTLFFDFLPIELGKVRDFSIRFQLYTVPGQVKYNATRKVVLKGADAVVFVADSQKEMKEANIESFNNMKENLISNNLNPDDLPIVLQYNKRDLPNAVSMSELNGYLNQDGQVYLEAEAVNGKGVQDTFQTITKLLIKDIAKKHRLEIQPAATASPPPAPPMPVEEPAPAIQEPPVEEAEIAEPVQPEISFEEPSVSIQEPLEETPVKEIEIAETVQPEIFFEEPPAPIQEPVEETHVEETTEEEATEAEAFSFSMPSFEEGKISFEEPAAEQATPVEEKATEEKHEEFSSEQVQAPISFQEQPVTADEEFVIPETVQPETYAEKPAAGREIWPAAEAKEAPSFPLERFEKLEESIKETNLLLSSLNSDTSRLLTSLQSAINGFYEELRAIKQEQKEMLTIVRGIKIDEAVERIKAKERSKKGGWFGMK